MNLLERKSKLRTELKNKNNSCEISVERLLSLSASRNSKFWAVYKPLKDEPTLTNLPENVKLCLPRTDSSDASMSFILEESVKSFSKSNLGVEEPIGGDEITKDQIDVIFIPGLAFDHSGNRLGRGKGYYDRYLKGYKGLKVGVCSKSRFLDFPVPVDHEFDVQVNFILTEDFIYQPVQAEQK